MFIHTEQLNCLHADTKNVLATKRPILTAEERERMYSTLHYAMLAYAVRWMQVCKMPDFIM